MIVVPSAHGFLGPYGAADPYFSSVVQLAHLDGSNGSTTFTNSCARGNTMTRTGTSTISTTQFEFGGASGRIPSGSSLGCASSADYNWGSSDFTLEWWQRLDSVTGASQVLLDCRPVNTNGFYQTVYSNGLGDIRYFTNNADHITGSAATLILTTWQFIALSKNSGSTRLFVAGTQVGSTYTDGNTYLQSQVVWGIGSFGTGAAQGMYIDDVRLTKGVGRYTSNFSPPTAAFPNH